MAVSATYVALLSTFCLGHGTEVETVFMPGLNALKSASIKIRSSVDTSIGLSNTKSIVMPVGVTSLIF